MWSKRQEQFIDEAKQRTAETVSDSGVYSCSFSGAVVTASQNTNTLVDDETLEALSDLAASYSVDIVFSE
ncbi:MAG: hypothetical protein RLO46_20300 [Pseudomonadales bacterium]